MASLNDFESVPDVEPIVSSEEENSVNDGDVTQVDVGDLLDKKEAMEKAIDATNDAAAQVGYQIGVAAEKSRALKIIEVFKEQDFMNENGKALLDALTAMIDKEDESEVTTDGNGDV